MADTLVFCCSITLQAFVVLFLLAVMVVDVQGGEGCPRFSCGHLKNISSPFRQRGDPPGCGSEYYELMCRDSKATVRISNVVYYVVDINYTDLSFSVVEANLDMSSSCPLPYYTSPEVVDLHGLANLEVEGPWACFANCSRAITNNSLYKPVSCLGAKDSFVYVWANSYGCEIIYLEHSCGYLAMAPFDGSSIRDVHLGNASYLDIMGFINKGFSVKFPYYLNGGPIDFDRGSDNIIKLCLSNSTSYFRERISDISILNRTRAFFWSEIHFFECLNAHNNTAMSTVFAKVMVYVIDVPRFLVGTCLLLVVITAAVLYEYVRLSNSCIPGVCQLIWAVLCRFVLAPLAVLIFLAYKYWKTRITIDAVEKFLLMQEMLGPIRYAYTDITAITSHFRDKLGQGGYGSVFKGVLLPGNVHVAVKMLEGNSNCKGEDFISEVSTIGRIHHVNVVHLLGFCSEEMRRALVYEYMPRGSLDKYIFSAEKIFSWDKLNEIALGIAQGINYLHQGCEMQILHFDIKPHNILLDYNFVPKVADFGLAKLYPRDNSFVPVSALRGTIGYIAPEMISRSFGIISSKSDVYSFGMLLLEMAGGRRNADPNAANSSQSYYPSWVYDRLTEQEVGEISPVDDMHELEKKLCIVGLWCIQMRSQDRPNMSEVIEMLGGGVDSLQMPSRPFFCDEGHTHVEDSYHLSSQLTTISEEDE